jgi:methionine synthase I (cobalamin-dependent)
VEGRAVIVETNTFGGNRLKLSLYNLADKVEEINRGL